MTNVVLVTGAGKGIGLELSKLYAKGAHNLVIGAVRDVSKVEKELKAANCQVVELDVSSDESCATLPARLSKLGVTHVNLVINNAGVMSPNDKLGSETLASEALRLYNTNALGPLRVTSALIPMLKVGAKGAPAKVVNVSSRMGSIEDNTSGSYYGYRASKAAENAISVSLARDLAKDNIMSLTVHPGYIRTSMTGDKGDMGPDECASKLSKLIDNAKFEDCYKFWHRDGTVLPW